jgi:tetratricopeptide (TPR) repeat protein
MSPVEPQNPLEAIVSQIETGAPLSAAEQLRSLIGEGLTAPDVYRLLAVAYLKCGAPDEAAVALADARVAGTNSATELQFGRFLNGRGHKPAALNCFLNAVELDPGNADALALVCSLYAELGQPETAIHYGQRSLDARDRQPGGLVLEACGSARSKPFDPASPHRNIISFSLFGDNPYYWDSAIAIASMALSIFPEWRCRFYCDPQVPEAVRRTLIRLNSQLFISPRDSVNWSGLFWRFYAFDDPDVDVVMIRDVDSPFTLREREAVEEWLASDFPFHVIRDHFNHTEPMMAGLWGGWTQLLPGLMPMTADYLSIARARFADQEFLRLHIWPRIRHATLSHDRFFRLRETRPVPRHATEDNTHIGMAWPRSLESGRQGAPMNGAGRG